jgi:hypothetical protein
MNSDNESGDALAAGSDAAVRNGCGIFDSMRTRRLIRERYERQQHARQTELIREQKAVRDDD